MKFILTLWLFLLGLTSMAQVTSSFDADVEGWTAAHLGGTAVTVNYQNTAGNPGGFVNCAPPTAGGTVNTSFTWYWNAPTKFFGDFDFSYGSTLSMDLQQSVAGVDNSQSDVIIYSGSNSIHYNFPARPAVAPAWTTYNIVLNESAGWKWGSSAGAAAVKAQLKIILANITGIRIRCKYSSASGYSSGLDNVSISKRTLVASPEISAFSPSTALANEVVTLMGSNFGATVNDNIVYFGTLRAEILSASTSQLKVVVPQSATLAPISVINVTTGLVSVSDLDFLPKAVADPDFIGNLLPGSFSANTIVPYGDFNDNGLAGADMGDIDGDGLLDIVAFEDGQDKFAIFLNQGKTGVLTSSSFSSKIEIPSGELGQGNSNGTLLYDFDNDGKIDIATYFRGVIPSLSGGFAISRNISTPGVVSFEPPEQFYNLGIFCSGFDAADLDGDGLVDFLINSSGLYYARNISTPGNIEFGSTRFLNASGGAVSTKDLNGDSRPEIVVVGTGYTILENTSSPGQIQFEAPVNFSGSVVSGVTLADLDSDTKPDIVYYRINGFNDYDLVVKKNIHTSGPITNSSFDSDIIVSKVGRAYSQRVADLNGDGKPDILIALNSGSTGYGFGIFQNKTPDGSLSTNSFMPIVEYEETSNGVLAIPLIGDFNQDLLPDVVGFASSDGGEHALILYTNQTVAAPTISVNSIYPIAAAVGSTITITGSKFSTDPAKNLVRFGSIEAQVLTATKDQLTVVVPPGAPYDRISVTRDDRTSRYHLPFSTLFSAGTTFNGTSFGAPVSFPVTGADYDVESADLNGDGKPELVAESRVVTGIIRNYAWSFENVHTSGPITSSSFAIRDTTNESAINLRLIDMDEDGRPDIVSQTALFRNTTISAGDLLFDNNINGVSGLNHNWADFDLDGKTDIIATDAGTSLLIYRNRSRPGSFRTGAFATFSSAIGLAKPSANGGTAVGDFDSDGWVDIATANSGSDNLRVWRNTGGFPLSAAQFVFVADLATGDNPSRVYTGDFDRDGKLDIFLYHSTGVNTTLLTLFHNTSTTGSISFNRIDLTNPSATTVATVSDLDGDGKPEILTTSEGGNRFSIFKNLHTSGPLTSGSFAAPFSTTVTAPRGITTSDLNLDGKPEIIITRAASLMEVYENLIPAIPPPTIISFTPVSGPVGITVTIVGTNFDPLPANNLVQFNGTTATVLTASLTQLEVQVPVGAVTGPITVTVNALTATSSTDFVVTASPVITVDQQPSDTTTCAGQTIMLTTLGSGTTQIAYNWQFATSLAGPYSDIASGSNYQNVNTSQLSINTTGNFGAGFYRCRITGDLALPVFTTPAMLTLVPVPTPPVVTGGITCGPGQVTLNATGGLPGQYRWYATATGGSPLVGETSATYLTTTLNATTSFFAAISNGFCESSRTEVLAIVNVPPSVPAITTNIPLPGKIITVCNSTTLILSGPDGFASYLWSNGVTSQDNTITASGTYSLQVTDDDGCQSPPSEVWEVTLLPAPCNNQPPAIASFIATVLIEGKVTIDLLPLLTDPDDNLNLASLRLATTTSQAGADAEVTAQYELVLDFGGVAFTGEDVIVVEVCDSLGECTQQELRIAVAGDIEVFNAISADGNDKNAILYLKYIDLLESTKSNKVTILDRWGTVVWQGTDYDNTLVVFRGTYENGTQLPSGTYYYIIEFKDRKSKTGYISLKR